MIRTVGADPQGHDNVHLHKGQHQIEKPETVTRPGGVAVSQGYTDRAKEKMENRRAVVNDYARYGIPQIQFGPCASFRLHMVCPLIVRDCSAGRPRVFPTLNTHPYKVLASEVDSTAAGAYGQSFVFCREAPFLLALQITAGVADKSGTKQAAQLHEEAKSPSTLYFPAMNAVWPFNSPFETASQTSAGDFTITSGLWCGPST